MEMDSLIPDTHTQESLSGVSVGARKPWRGWRQVRTPHSEDAAQKHRAEGDAGKSLSWVWGTV